MSRKVEVVKGLDGVTYRYYKPLDKPERLTFTRWFCEAENHKGQLVLGSGPDKDAAYDNAARILKHVGDRKAYKSEEPKQKSGVEGKINDLIKQWIEWKYEIPVVWAYLDHSSAQVQEAGGCATCGPEYEKSFCIVYKREELKYTQVLEIKMDSLTWFAHELYPFEDMLAKENA